MAEWSKALVLGTSLSGVVGSNPTLVNVADFIRQRRVVMWRSIVLLTVFARNPMHYWRRRNLLISTALVTAETK